MSAKSVLLQADVANIEELSKCPEVSGWLTSSIGPPCIVSLSPLGKKLFIAKGRRVLITSLVRGGTNGVLKQRMAKRVDLLPEEGDATVGEWLLVGADAPVLMIGTDKGVLIILNQRGAVLHRQRLARAAVLAASPRARVEGSVNPNNFAGGASSVPGGGAAAIEELNVLLAPSTLVAIDGVHLSHLAKEGQHLDPCEPVRAEGAHKGGGPPGEDKVSVRSVVASFRSHGIPCTTWKLEPDTTDPQAVPQLRAFAAVGRIRGSALDVYGQHSGRGLVVVGLNPTMAAFQPATESPLSATRLAKDAAKKVTSMAYTFVKSSLLSWGPSRTADESPEESESSAKEVETPPPRLLRSTHVFSDPTRSMDTISVDPTVRFAATSDNLGRVAFVDLHMFVVIKLLKGYREAQFAWLYLNDTADRSGRGSPAMEDASPTVARGTFLVVYLPRRGTVEVWCMNQRHRIAAARVGYDCRLLPLVKCFTRTETTQVRCCYLLRGDGMLTSLTFETMCDAMSDDETNTEEVKDSMLQKWEVACTTDPSKLVSLLDEIKTPAEVDECLKALPPTLPPQLWLDVFNAAVARVEDLGGALDASFGVDDDEVSHSAGGVYRQLVNKVAVLHAYTMLHPLCSRGSDKVEYAVPEEWAETARMVGEELVASDLGCLPTCYDVLREAETWMSHQKGPEDTVVGMSPVDFLLHFDTAKCAVRLVSVTPALANFFFAGLLTPRHSDSAFAAVSRAAHMLSLSNTDVISVLLRWGGADCLGCQQPYMHLIKPDVFSRLILGYVCDSARESHDLPRELREIGDLRTLHHVTWILASAWRRLKEGIDEVVAGVVLEWLAALLATLELKLTLIPANPYPEDALLEEITVADISNGLPPAALAAFRNYRTATFTPVPSGDAPHFFAYLTQREAVAAYHFHSALLEAFLHSRGLWQDNLPLTSPARVVDDERTVQWERYASGVLQLANVEYPEVTTPFWWKLPQSAMSHVSAILTLSTDAPSGSPAFTAIAAGAAFGSCRMVLAPVATVVTLARRQRVPPSAVLGGKLKPMLDTIETCIRVLSHTQKVLHALGDLTDPAALMQSVKSTSSIWWGLTPRDSMLEATVKDAITTSVGLENLSSLMREVLVVLRFMHITLNDAMSTSDDPLGAGLHWSWYFTPRALALLQKGKAVGDSDDEHKLIQKRRELIEATFRRPGDVDHALSVGNKLADAFGFPDKQFVMRKAAHRYLIEGLEDKASGLGVVPDEDHVSDLVMVVRLRMKCILSGPLAGGGSQKKYERSLNLMSRLPVEMMRWVEVSHPDELLVREWVAKVPPRTAYERLRALSARTLEAVNKYPRFKQDALRIREVRDFTQYLLQNV